MCCGCLIARLATYPQLIKAPYVKLYSILKTSSTSADSEQIQDPEVRAAEARKHNMRCGTHLLLIHIYITTNQSERYIYIQQLPTTTTITILIYLHQALMSRCLNIYLDLSISILLYVYNSYI